MPKITESAFLLYLRMKISFLILSKFQLVASIAILLCLNSCGKSNPSEQFVFFNSSNEELELVIERDGTYEHQQKIPAHSNHFVPIKPGKVKIMTFNAQNDCLKIRDNFVVEDDSSDAYTCIDLEGKIKYMMVSTSYLYAASNSLAQAIADTKAGGGMQFLGGIQSADEDFKISFAPHWPYEKLPKKIGALNASWALVPIYMPTEDKEALYPYIDMYLKGLGTQ